MSQPLQGLKSLLNVLKKTGFLKLGLYSELARQDIVKAKSYIAKNNLQPIEEDIRNFRKRIFSNELIDLNSLKNKNDFYSLSPCRDLCFHSQEHRFTINQLENIIQSNKLKFLGFLLHKNIKSIYKNNYQEDPNQTNLKNWEKFENKHLNTFKGMYQFWVTKL